MSINYLYINTLSDMDINIIINCKPKPKTITTPFTTIEAAIVLSDMPFLRGISSTGFPLINFSEIRESIYQELPAPPPTTHIDDTFTAKSRLRGVSNLSKPSFKNTKKNDVQNPLGLCPKCRGLYVWKHIDRHMSTCDGTLRWCKYNRQNIQDYLDHHPDECQNDDVAMCKDEYATIKI